MTTTAAMTEAQLQAAVIELAQVFKWRCYHTYDSRRSQAGFPDLVLCRERVIFLELKSSKGRLATDQIAWAQALNDAGAEYHCFRPSDWVSGEIEAALRPPKNPDTTTRFLTLDELGRAR